MTTARTVSSLEVWQSSLPGLPETIEVSQTVAQSFEDIGINVKLVEVEFARALDAFRDRHDAHFILPVRQTHAAHQRQHPHLLLRRRGPGRS